MDQAAVLSALVFAGTAGLIVGAYWALVLRREQKVLQRITPPKTKKQSGSKPLDVLKPDENLSSVGSIDRVLRTSGLAAPIQQLLDQAGRPMTVSVFLLATACTGLLALIITFHYSRMVTVGLMIGAVGASVPFLLMRRRRRKRIDKFEEQFPEAVDLIARALRAGHGLQTGVGMAADELAAPVGTEFRILFDEQNFGLSLNDAMRNFARRVPVLDARFFVTAVLTQRETGGNLAEVLDNLGNVIRERFKIKRQVRVLSAHGRTTGWVLALLPPALAMATLILNPHHLGSLLEDPLGQKLIMVGVTLQIMGMLVIRKIVNVEY